ncbi:MAG: hypothetical protein E7D52_01245 [Peptoniphilus harei]|uniref:hypothetical protein n=1 Tax=Peptoniphilus harei TaxID=54005 RepID=UPI0028FF70E5|nr:hypothetical protein [Peptoniphilus harei]MDU2373149.1 hypothetical protein [Peptoniphilus harei]
MSNLKVNLSKEVLDFLEEKNTAIITLDRITNKSCCGSGLPSSDVYIGPSKRRNKNYSVFEENNTEVFIDKELIFVDDICNIDIVKFPFTKTLVANFLDYKRLI